jgi:hydroxymethylbilane synthase
MNQELLLLEVLRRQAQWLNKYPTHKAVDLRGNVNTECKITEQRFEWLFAPQQIRKNQLKASKLYQRLDDSRSRTRAMLVAMQKIRLQ